jgi:hypothetical protein
MVTRLRFKSGVPSARRAKAVTKKAGKLTTREVGSDDYLALQRSTNAMQVELKQRNKQYSTTDYIRAKKLLNGLAYQVVRPERAIAKSESLPTRSAFAAE